MPLSTAGFAEVGAGDPQPLVVSRGGQHPLEQLPVRSLERSALLELALPLGDLGGEGVAHRLKLAEVERSWLPRRGRHAGVDPEARECLGDKPAELPLEASDLAPQLGAREKFVPADKRLSPVVSVKQIRHNPNRV